MNNSENNSTISMKQENKHGSDSPQIGIQNNYYGMNYENTKALCMDLINSELNIYKNEAEQTALIRDNKLLENFFERLHNENMTDSSVLKEFKNPDMQYCYVEAQKSYMRTGTKDLEDTLAQLLVDRVKTNEHNLLQIALGEAIKVVPLLLPQQLDILAMCFILRYTRSTHVYNLHTFFSYIKKVLLPHISECSDKGSLYQHLVYTNTASIDITEISLEEVFKNVYPVIFQKGIAIDEVHDYISKYPDLFIKSLYNPLMVQLSTFDLNTLNNACTMFNVTEEDKKYLTNLFKSQLMLPNEIRKVIIKNQPQCSNLFNLWNNSTLKHLSLTSVGIVLGAKRSNQISGETYDLSIWI